MSVEKLNITHQAENVYKKGEDEYRIIAEVKKPVGLYGDRITLFQAPLAKLAQKKLSGSVARMLLWVLANVKMDNRVHIHVDSACEDTGISRSGIYAAIKILVEIGVMVPEFKNSSAYVMNPDIFYRGKAENHESSRAFYLSLIHRENNSEPFMIGDTKEAGPT
jgi:hypothetical protein